MTDCTSCGARSELYLCGRCRDDLRETLRGLAIGEARNPGSGESRPTSSLINYLEDAVLGQTRLGESERRSTEHGSPMLVNLGASQLFDDLHWLLNQWVAKVNIGVEALSATGGTDD